MTVNSMNVLHYLPLLLYGLFCCWKVVKASQAFIEVNWNSPRLDRVQTCGDKVDIEANRKQLLDMNFLLCANNSYKCPLVLDSTGLIVKTSPPPTSPCSMKSYIAFMSDLQPTLQQVTFCSSGDQLSSRVPSRLQGEWCYTDWRYVEVMRKECVGGKTRWRRRYLKVPKGCDNRPERTGTGRNTRTR